MIDCMMMPRLHVFWTRAVTSPPVRGPPTLIQFRCRRQKDLIRNPCNTWVTKPIGTATHSIFIRREPCHHQFPLRFAANWLQSQPHRSVQTRNSTGTFQVVIGGLVVPQLVTGTGYVRQCAKEPPATASQLCDKSRGQLIKGSDGDRAGWPRRSGGHRGPHVPIHGSSAPKATATRPRPFVAAYMVAYARLAVAIEQTRTSARAARASGTRNSADPSRASPGLVGQRSEICGEFSVVQCSFSPSP